jgi:hypothetical protein
MPCLILFDVAPDPTGIGLLVAMVILVVGIIALLAAGLVVYLWHRKRSLRGVEMIRPDTVTTAQPSNPNQL